MKESASEESDVEEDGGSDGEWVDVSQSSDGCSDDEGSESIDEEDNEVDGDKKEQPKPVVRTNKKKKPIPSKVSVN